MMTELFFFLDHDLIYSNQLAALNMCSISLYAILGALYHLWRNSCVSHHPVILSLQGALWECGIFKAVQWSTHLLFFPHSVLSIFIVLKIHIQLNESYEFNSGMSWSWITFTSSPALSLSLSLPHFWPFSVDCLKYLCHHGADWSISLVRFLEAPAENLTGCVKPCVPGVHLLLSVYFRIFLSRPLMWFTGKLVYMYSVSRWVFR